MTQSKLMRSLFLIAISAYLPSTFAQLDLESQPSCIQASQMTEQQLQGQWQGSLSGPDESVRIILGPHPEWQGNVKGTVERPDSDSRHPMVGDVNQGLITLEESADGVRITGTWLGQTVDNSCAQEIRGQFQAGEDGATQAFVLRKMQP